MNPRFLLPLPLLVVFGCQTQGEVGSVDLGESDPTEMMRQKGAIGSANGQYDYCDGLLLCAQGEGDCDGDLQCDLGLACIDDLGDNFGLAWTTDVCAPSHCGDGSLNGDETAIDFGGSCGSTCGGTPGTIGYCRPGCECAEGGGDCSTDADCQAGLVCGNNNGAQFGLHWTYDVCVQATCSDGVQNGDETGIDFGGSCGGACSGQNGDQEGFCTPGCPCGQGEGDCDSDAECEAGLACILNQGGDWGMDPLHDVCLQPFAVGDLADGDLVITEIMMNPFLAADASAEWFELYNNTTNSINLNGLYVRDNASVQVFTVTTNLIVGAGEYVSFARTANTATNGGFVPDYDYVNTFALNDTTDSIILQAGAGGTELDRIIYDTTWTRPVGRSAELSRNAINLNNNDPTLWCESFTPLPSGDYGSPGAQNRFCP
jgi:hypothetical protein